MKTGALLKGWLIPVIALCAVCIVAGVLWGALGSRKSGGPEENTPVTGTWVDADSWEGKEHSGVLLEFTPEGILIVNGYEVCSYRCENGCVYLVSRGSGREAKCSVTGDYLSVKEYAGGVGLPRSANDFIRISDSVGLSGEQVLELY